MKAVTQVPWHPALFAAAWVLNAYVAASPSPYAALRALLVAVLVAVALTGIGRLLLGRWHRGGIAATALIVLMTIGRDITIVIGNTVRVLPLWQLAILAGVLALSVGLATYLLRDAISAPQVSNRIGRGLAVISTALVLTIVVGGLLRGTLTVGDLRQGVSMSSFEQSGTRREGPDIYLIILDGYPSSATLRDNHGIDVSSFLDQLRDRGFTVDPAGHSNYLLTQLTLTSLLHMAQIPDIPALSSVVAGEAPAQPTARRVLNNNPVFDFLRARGYAVVTYAIPFEHPALRQADVLIELDGANEFERQLVASTFLLDAWNLIDRDPFAGDLRSQIEASLREIPKVAANRDLGARFVIAHILTPRPPFLFDAFGRAVTSGLPIRQDDLVGADGLSQAMFSSLLADQIAFVNSATIEAIDGIMRESPEPPVIVVMSDHGTRPAVDVVPATPRESRDAFGTLFAALTPGREQVFPPGITPAQVMASLLNSYFGARFPISPSESFASAGKDPFRLIPVPAPMPP